VRDPDPRRVVRLAAVVVEHELDAADVDLQLILVRHVGVAERAGEERRRVELLAVDDGVVAVGSLVAVKARGHVLVADHLHVRALVKGQDAHAVVDVAVRVDDRVHLFVVEALLEHTAKAKKAHRGEEEADALTRRWSLPLDLGAKHHVATIDQHKAHGRVHDAHVCKGVHEGHILVKLCSACQPENTTAKFIPCLVQEADDVVATRRHRVARLVAAPVRIGESLHPQKHGYSE